MASYHLISSSYCCISSSYLIILSMISSVFQTEFLSPVLQLHISLNSSTISIIFKILPPTSLFSKFLEQLQFFKILQPTYTFQGLDLVFRSIRQGDEGEYVCISEGRLPQVNRCSFTQNCYLTLWRRGPFSQIDTILFITSILHSPSSTRHAA